MEELINKIIEIDNNAKSIIKEEKDKKDNFEEFIDSEFNTKKAVLDLQFKDEINKQKEKYNILFEENKVEIENNTNQEIITIKKNYSELEENIISDLIEKIKNQ